MAMCSHAQTLQPYQGRNPCMERNLMVQSNSVEELGCNGNVLVDKSSKHTSSEQYRLPAESQVLIPQDYVAQNTSQLIQLRSATPIPYVQNVISENGGPSYNKLKQTNMLDSCTQESPRKKGFGGWSSFKKLLSSKKMYTYSKCQIDREDSKSNLLAKQNGQAKIVDTNVTISSKGKYVNDIIGRTSTSVNLSEKNDKNSSQASSQKHDNDNEPSVRPSNLPLVPLRSKKSESNLTRQESIDKFNEVFNVGSSLNVLKDPNMRIKTPGDLPPSVRKVRGRSQSTARFSLYDDRIMCNIFNEEDDQSDKTMSNSVPFGMDMDCDSKTLPPKLNAKDITCF